MKKDTKDKIVEFLRAPANIYDYIASIGLLAFIALIAFILRM